jgi:hypothetical protein
LIFVQQPVQPDEPDPDEPAEHRYAQRRDEISMTFADLTREAAAATAQQRLN